MIEKETVCIATDETKKQGYNVPNGFIGKYGYFFTQEQLNKYTENIIKESLEIAKNNLRQASGTFNSDYFSQKQSITNSFNEIYKKLKV